MKIIFLLRTFAFFPFCGIAIPDTLFALNDPNYHMPVFHIAACISLLAVIIGSFAVTIAYTKLKSFKETVALFFNN